MKLRIHVNENTEINENQDESGFYFSDKEEYDINQLVLNGQFENIIRITQSGIPDFLINFEKGKDLKIADKLRLQYEFYKVMFKYAYCFIYAFREELRDKREALNLIPEHISGKTKDALRIRWDMCEKMLNDFNELVDG